MIAEVQDWSISENLVNNIKESITRYIESKIDD